jgi:hypothetical protein
MTVILCHCLSVCIALCWVVINVLSLRALCESDALAAAAAAVAAGIFCM